MFKRLLLCFTLLLAVVGAKADDAYWTLTFPADTQESSNSYTATWTASMTAGGAWSISAFNNYQNTWTSIRAGWKTAATTATIATTSACEPAIGEIVVTVETLSSTSSVTSAYLQVASDADFSTIVETVTIDDATITAGAGDWTYTITTPTKNAYYKLVYEMAQCSSNGVLRISQVAYYEAEDSEDDDDDDEDDAEPGVIYLLGASNDWTMAATNVNLTETEAGSKVYYNEAVTFTAGDYIAIYTQIDTSWGKDYRYAGYSSGEAISLNTETKLYNNAELGWETSFYISTAGTYAVTVDMSDSTDMTILIYDESYTVSLPNNLYFFGNDGVWSTTAHAGELTETSEGIWEGEMTVTSGYFTLIDTISETSDDWTTINAHRYYPAGDKAITLGDSSSMGYGADGSWTINNGTYDVVVNCNTLKLIVTAQSEEEETTVDTLTVAEAIAIIEAGSYTSDSVYVKGIVSQIDSVYYTYYGNANYYISDDGATDSQFYIYRGLGLNGASFTSADDLWVGDTLILYGVLTTYNSTPEMAAKNYIVYQGRPESTGDDDEEEEETTVDTLTVAEAIAIIEAGSYTSDSVYVKGIVSQIDSVYYTYYGNANYYISDDGTTDSQFYIFRGLGLNGASFTSADDLLVGDTLILYGVLTLYYSTPEMAAKNYIVYQGRPESTDGDEDGDDTGDTDDSGEYVYTLVTDASTLAEGDVVTIVNETYSVVIGENNSTYFGYSSATIVDNTIAASEVVTPITLEAVDGGYWKLQLSDGSYLYAVSTSSNQLGATTETLTDSSDIAAISIAQDESTSSYDATILFQKSESDRTLIQYNNGTYGRFSCYKSDGSSNQNPVQLYRRTEGTMPEVIDTLSVAEALALIEASENTSDSVYVKGIVSQIDSVYYTYYGNANYYISDDGTTDSQFYIYRGLGLNGASFTSADDLLVGDTLIVYGVLTSYNSTPEMAAKNYIVYQGRPESTGDDDEEEEDTTTYDVYAKTSEITSGQSYLIVVQDGTNTLYATNHSASYTYGYLYTNTVSGLVDTISVDASGYNAFVITASETTDGAYTIQDSYGRYLYHTGTYKSFNLSSTNDSYDWTIVANEDGTWTITSASTNYWMQYSTSYSSFGVYSSEQSGALLPYLYELVSSDEEGDGDDTGDGDEDGDDTGDDDEEDTTEIVAYYTLVTDTDDLSDGDTITIVNEQYSVAISALASSGNYFTETAVTIADDTLAATADVTPVILSATDDGNWLLMLEDGTYMAAIGTGSSNYLGVLEEVNDTSAVASIDIALDEDEVYYSATILFQSTSNRNLLQYNHTNTRFSCYKSDGSSTQYPVQIYSKVTTSDGTATAISSVENESATLRQGVYTLTGVKLNSADNLPAGIYIVDGQKVLVK